MYVRDLERALSQCFTEDLLILLEPEVMRTHLLLHEIFWYRKSRLKGGSK